MACTKIRNPGTTRNTELNLTVLFCFPITDHVKKMKCQGNLFTHVITKSLVRGTGVSAVSGCYVVPVCSGVPGCSDVPGFSTCHCL